MRSTSKYVVFTRSSHEKRTITRPTAVFANTKTAMVYKARLSAAHAAKDVQRVMALDPKAPLTPEGKLHDDTKFTVVELPYEPTEEVAERQDDTFEL